MHNSRRSDWRGFIRSSESKYGQRKFNGNLSIDIDPMTKDHLIGHSQATKAIVVANPIIVEVHNTDLIQVVLPTDNLVLIQSLMRMIYLNDVEKPKALIQWPITLSMRNPPWPLMSKLDVSIIRRGNIRIRHHILWVCQWKKRMRALQQEFVDEFRATKAIDVN